MKAVRVFAGGLVLYGFFLLGGVLSDALGLPLPGSVLGMVLLWGALEAGVVKLAWIVEGATTLIGLFGLLFVPAGVGFVAFVDAGWVWVGAVAVTGAGAMITISLTGVLVQRGLDRA